MSDYTRYFQTLRFISSATCPFWLSIYKVFFFSKVLAHKSRWELILHRKKFIKHYFIKHELPRQIIPDITHASSRHLFVPFDHHFIAFWGFLIMARKTSSWIFILRTKKCIARVYISKTYHVRWHHIFPDIMHNLDFKLIINIHYYLFS